MSAGRTEPEGLSERLVDLKKRLIELTEPVIGDHGAELVDLELRGAEHNQVIRLLIHKDPGATLELCEAISREAADLLEVEDPVPGRYRLEVTSPGLDRPLVSDADFDRARSRALKVILSSGRRVDGRLVDWNGEFVMLEYQGSNVSIERREIAKATIQAEL